MSISRALLGVIIQSPQYTSPLPGSPAGPLWREMPISEPSFTHPPGAQLKELPYKFPSQSSHGDRYSISRALFQLSLSVPSEENPPPPLFSTGPL